MEKVSSLSEDNRIRKETYIYRISVYSEEIDRFLIDYYSKAKTCGAVIEDNLNTPEPQHISFLTNKLGIDLKLDIYGISEQIKTLISGISDARHEAFVSAIYNALSYLKKTGKTDGMIRNAYIKFLYWSYYKFQQIIKSENKRIPKILYVKTPSLHELLYLNILCKIGCDVVIVTKSEHDYEKTDPKFIFSKNLEVKNGKQFPKDFSLEVIKKKIEETAEKRRLYGEEPQKSNCTNAWITGNIFDDVRILPKERGTDNRFFYNIYGRINGVEEKSGYEKKLFDLYKELENQGRTSVVINRKLTPPSVQEIAGIQRKQYTDKTAMIRDLTVKLTAYDQELQTEIRKAFVDVMLSENNGSLQNLLNTAVYVLCWYERYKSGLYSKETGVLFYMGDCDSKRDAVFLKFIARTPADVIILNPENEIKGILEDKLLYEVNNVESIPLTEFPVSSAKVGTVAYHAERDLDTILYQDTGIYRSQQYKKTSVISLKTMYEEISILWDKEINMRPGFSTSGVVANIPVIFSKICGVKYEDVSDYIDTINELKTDDTTIFKKIPVFTHKLNNKIKPFATKFLKNGKLQREFITGHSAYQYGFLDKDKQDYIFDKLQELIDTRIIKGTFENGMEYLIVSTVLDIDISYLRQIQSFDFTKRNPKLIYVCTDESVLTIEDSIFAAFMHFVGYDILFFVPTGYNSIEKYFNHEIWETHQIGAYKYDVIFTPQKRKRSLFEIAFGTKK